MRWNRDHFRLDSSSAMLTAMLKYFSILLLSAGLPAATNSLTPAEAREGWILLFDGKSMDGWDDPHGKTPPGDAWSIADGCLKAKAKPRITEDLFTKETFRDF